MTPYILQAVAHAAAMDDSVTMNKLLECWMLPLQPALYNALRAGRLDIARDLLRHGCRIDPEAEYAARCSDNPEVYGVLLNHGWDPNRDTGFPGDALICAVGEDKLPHVQYLLEHGADPNINFRGGPYTGLYTALDIAAMKSSPAMLYLLLKHGAQTENLSALNKAAAAGRLENIGFLLDKGVAIDAIPEDKDFRDLVLQNAVGTALHDAAEAGKADAVQLLLQRGANKLVKDTAGHTAREVALKKGHHECAKLLE